MLIASVNDGSARCARLDPERTPVAGQQRIDHVQPGQVQRRCDIRSQPPERCRRDAQQIEHHVDQQQPGPEAGERHACHRDNAAEVVDQRLPVQRGQHAQRHAEQKCQQQAGQSQFQRRRQALDEVPQHRAAGGRTLAKVAMQQPGHVALVLDRNRLVEPHLALDLLEVLRRGEGSRLHQRRIARQHHRQQEADQRHAEQRRDNQCEASKEIPAERHAARRRGGIR